MIRILRSRIRITVPFWAIALLIPQFSVAQELSDALRASTRGLFFNARALGMGNAYSTIGYDFSAVHFNPATMAAADGGAYTMSLAANGYRTTSDYFGTETHFTTSNTAGSQVGLTIPFSLDSTRNLFIAAGYTQSKDFNFGYKYEGLNRGDASFTRVLALLRDPTARAIGLTYQQFDSSGNDAGDTTILGSGLYESGYLLNEGGMYVIPVGVAVRALGNVFVGVSGSYIVGRLTSDLELTGSDPNDAYPLGVLTVPGNPVTDGFAATDYRLVRSKVYRGWDARFGVLYRLENFIGVSAAFRMPGPHTVDDEVYIDGVTRFSNNTSLAVHQDAAGSSFTFQPPAEITVGAMINLWILTGTAELRYLDYSQMKITAGGGDLPDRTAINKRIKDELGAVVNLNVGAEFRLPLTGLSARAGVVYEPSQYKAEPPKFAQKYLTAGVGFNTGGVMQFDLGYAYGWRGEHKSQETVDEGGADRTIEYNAFLLTMRFSP